MQEIIFVNPSRRGAKKKRHGSHRRKNPHRAHRARKHHAARRKHNPRRRTFRHRNPSLSLGGLKGMFMPAVWGGAGAIATDILYRLLPLPGALAMLKGPLSPVTKVAVALGTAQLAKMVVGAKSAHEMLSGSLAVIAYGLLNDLVLSRLPVIGAPVSGYEMQGLGYTSPGNMITGPGMRSGMSEYVSGMDEYVSGYELSGA